RVLPGQFLEQPFQGAALARLGLRGELAATSAQLTGRDEFHVVPMRFRSKNGTTTWKSSLPTSNLDTTTAPGAFVVLIKFTPMSRLICFPLLLLFLLLTGSPASANNLPAFTNSIGMRFVSVPGLTNVMFSVWLTRVEDFRRFVSDRTNNAGYDY